VPFYGLQEVDGGQLMASAADFSTHQTAPEAIKVLGYRAKIGSTNGQGLSVQAELIDTPKEFTQITTCKARFITVAFDIQGNQYLNAIEWGYGLDAAGVAYTYGPQLPDAAELAQIQQGAGKQWNADPNTSIKLPVP
jgi:hypothetical protein